MKISLLAIISLLSGICRAQFQIVKPLEASKVSLGSVKFSEGKFKVYVDAYTDKKAFRDVADQFQPKLQGEFKIKYYVTPIYRVFVERTFIYKTYCYMFGFQLKGHRKRDMVSGVNMF